MPCRVILGRKGQWQGCGDRRQAQGRPLQPSEVICPLDGKAEVEKRGEVEEREGTWSPGLLLEVLLPDSPRLIYI